MRDKTLGHFSEVKLRKLHIDLEAEIARYPARYRHPAAARRHILMDKQQKANRRAFHRASRRAAKLELA